MKRSAGTRHYRVAEREAKEAQIYSKGKMARKTAHLHHLVLCLAAILIFMKGFAIGYCVRKHKHN